MFSLHSRIGHHWSFLNIIDMLPRHTLYGMISQIINNAYQCAIIYDNMADISRAELKYLVQHQREEIKILNEVGKILSSTTDPDSILQLTARYLNQAFPIALCGIWLQSQKKLHLIPFAPLAQVELASAIRQIRESASTLLGQTVTEDASVPETPSSNESADSWHEPTTLRSHIWSPLTVKGQVTGLLSLFSGQTEAFSKEDRHAVGIVAEQLGAALRNALLVDELRQADELKNEMLSIVSHELSTPLTAIKEGVNLVLDGALGDTTEDQREFLSTVVENTTRLERLLQKVRISTQVMTGQLQVHFESVDLRTLIADVEKTYHPLAESKQVNLKKIDNPKPIFWQIDKAHATQALSQLVENAIQATPADGIVTIKLAATAENAEIQVLDTGTGIEKNNLPTLFEMFKSLGDINERKMGGLGLGLFIAKSLIDSHRGKIEVNSTLGEGTRMTITLPKQTSTDTI